MNYMKILMDSDCLIKLTKSGLKESICKKDEVTIPFAVKQEVVDVGKNKRIPDADWVEKNIQRGILSVTMARKSGSTVTPKGDQALIEAFHIGGYDVIATDDVKLIRSLKSLGIRWTLPGLIIYSLYQRKKIDKVTGLNWLEKLSSFISDDEYNMVRFLLEGRS
jgi:rRNA-processing protein FCF1